VRSKWHPSSITSSARASSTGGEGSAERFRGREVDHQFEFGGRLGRQLAGFVASENAIASILRAAARILGLVPANADTALHNL
jgi:hypothetical protein